MSRPATGHRTGVLLAGEPMGLLIADSDGDLAEVERFTMAIAGSEYNVAVGLARLGIPATYLTKLGSDSAGRRIAAGLTREGIHTEGLVWSDQHSTGLMFKGRNSSGDPAIDYFRRGSAASTFAPADIPDLVWDTYDTFHLTGILPALSPQTWDLCQRLISLSREHGLRVTFDPNLRPQLWPDRATMAERINSLALKADIVMPGIEEGRILTGQDAPEAIADWYISRGVPAVVVKIGSDGAYLATDTQRRVVPGFRLDRFVDTVGAGDGFAAGLLSAIEDGRDLPEAVVRGNAIGAIQVQSRGDNEGLPTRDELEAFMRRRPEASPDRIGAPSERALQ